MSQRVYVRDEELEVCTRHADVEGALMMTVEHTRDGQVQRVVVTRGAAGWHVREERDSQVVRQVTYTDWHRVERAVQIFESREDGDYSTKR